MDRDAWQATVHGVAKSQTSLSDFTFLFSSGTTKAYHLQLDFVVWPHRLLSLGPNLLASPLIPALRAICTLLTLGPAIS